MRLTNRIIAILLLPMFLVSSSASAQQARVVDAATLDLALAGKADTERDQRDQVVRVLQRDDVRQMATRLGLDVATAATAVNTLSGADLGTLAQHASALEAAELAGGVNTIVISTTTLLLILIIVILLAS